MKIETLLVILMGAVSFGLGTAAAVSETFASKYVRTSPKARIWRKLLGEQRAIVAMRRVFGPLAMLLGAGMIAFGGYSLLR